VGDQIYETVSAHKPAKKGFKKKGPDHANSKRGSTCFDRGKHDRLRFRYAEAIFTFSPKSKERRVVGDQAKKNHPFERAQLSSNGARSICYVCLFKKKEGTFHSAREKRFWRQGHVVVRGKKDVESGPEKLLLSKT